MHFSVPAYSQYLDVRNCAWKRRSYGIVALKMVMDYYEPRRAAARSLPHLIRARTRAHALVRNKGWSHAGLARIAKQYGFHGENYDWCKQSPREAFRKFKKHLARGPMLASIYRGLKPNAHGHLVVITGFKEGVVYYHDPDSRTRHDIARRATLAKFLKGWKRRIVVICPRLQRKKQDDRMVALGGHVV